MFSDLVHRSARFAVLVAVVLCALGVTMAQKSKKSSEDVKERLLEALSTDRSVKVRAQAALSLANFTDDEKVLDALIQAMSDKSSVVRGTVARVLGLSKARKAFATLCQASLDTDKFVSKWASDGLLQVLKAGHEFRVVVGAEVPRIRNATAMECEDIRRAMMDGLLAVLAADPKIDIETMLVDFTGKASSDASKRDIVLVVFAELVDARKEDGQGIARVRVRVTSMPGCKVWEGIAEGKAVQKPPEEDEFRDEYSMPNPEVDPRIEAAEVGAREAVLNFIRTIRQDSTDTPANGGQDGR